MKGQESSANFLNEKKYSIAETARELCVDRRTVQRYILDGKLKSLRYSYRKQVIPESYLKTFLQNAEKRSEQFQLF